MLNYSWKASPNRWGRQEFNTTFSIGFGNGLFLPLIRFLMDLQVIFFVGWKTIELNSSINRNQGDILCGKSDAMPPDEFWTELCDSLTAFYDNILKKSGAGGRPASKHLSRKFVTQTASVPDPHMVPCQYPLTTPTQTQSSPLPTLPLPSESLQRRRPLRRNLPRPPKNRRRRC